MQLQNSLRTGIEPDTDERS